MTYDSDKYLWKPGEITLAPQPKLVGWWVMYPQAIQKTKFCMYYKPTNEQIKNTEALLGWGWEDEE